MSIQAKTLPGRYYTDPNLFERELETIFCQMWKFCSGRTEQIPNPGDYCLCEVAGESLIVTRENSGEIHAFYNVCRHRGTRICREERGKFPGRIQCPYHGWTYGLDGKPLRCSSHGRSRLSPRGLPATCGTLKCGTDTSS